ncbi:SRPBCC family protein [Cereibacter sphaeroides]|uniref:SRPBCC family protein n=1 Tax=Cereibacter sphaeroides TaxID=1063 RepID=A0AAX1URN6_CERSP|nr:SRPBCC family protein [Cereibacter sphaeroides]RHZ98743.1 SRPBCC family protein [Cereibacter sphaeroides]
MRLSTSQEVEAPIRFVWRQLSDFGNWERAASQRGVTVRRLDGTPEEGPGTGWLVRFDYHGRMREVEMRLVGLEADQKLLMEATGHSLRADLTLAFLELAPRRTRVTVTSDVKALTLPSRIFLQSLRLAQGTLQEKFDGRIKGFAAEIGRRWQARRKAAAAAAAKGPQA